MLYMLSFCIAVIIIKSVHEITTINLQSASLDTAQASSPSTAASGSASMSCQKHPSNNLENQSVTWTPLIQPAQIWTVWLKLFEHAYVLEKIR